LKFTTFYPGGTYPLKPEIRRQKQAQGAQTRATSIDVPRRQYPLHVDENCLTQSVADIEAPAGESGIDVVSDGEFGKSIIWAQYALERLSGFERRPIEQEAAMPIKRALRRILHGNRC
jgi:hypothetical protein